ncbi:hypothetical protein LOTGIDRAFT_174923 [Lottia gigantea]|uniref:Methyltransferase FkbM domain-containing protein n=1 Tax=Lottia gigantea TaxID=225164 RepID=V3ZXJ7_LOTGI|nr:hypothetical protein LOTGIDRAFT_174923 [Lottia gigantea]ESO96268.1 hypothetical protein LOTGIDRAFT_174923 [Lottia gigantea]
MSQIRSSISNISINTMPKQHKQTAHSISTTNIPWIPIATVNPMRTKAEILRWNRGSWEEWDNFCHSSTGLDSANLHTPAGGMTIFIHDTKVDRWVSGSIKKSGAWEYEILTLIHHYMARDPDMHLLDIGSHVGQYSLMGARMGRQVIAVDPLYENVIRLCSSIQHNKFSSKIKVFYTALSDIQSTVSFIQEHGNVGGTKIMRKKSSSNITLESSTATIMKDNTGLSHIKVVQTPSEFDKNTIQTVLLDDLLPFVTFKKAFMKIDVESHENSVLKGGEEFFKSVEIPCIFMEWFQHAKKQDTAAEILDFMKRHKYTPRQPKLEGKIPAADLPEYSSYFSVKLQEILEKFRQQIYQNILPIFC